MNNVDFYLLNAINSGRNYAKDFMDNSPARYTEIDEALKALRAAGLIRYLNDLGPYEITLAGKITLRDERDLQKQTADEAAKEKKKKHLGCFLEIIKDIGLLLCGALIEHFFS